MKPRKMARVQSRCCARSQSSTTAFKNAAEESTTRLHELAHATGHAKRLARNAKGKFGDVDYAFEELVAEIASSFVGVTLNLPTDIPNHAN